MGYGQQAFEYLADYLFRVAISNQRIIKLDKDKVTFWYKESHSGQRNYVTLPVEKFIRRFLQHVLPKGFVKIRYYGFYAPGNRTRLCLIKELLGADLIAPMQVDLVEITVTSEGGAKSNLNLSVPSVDKL